MITDEDRKAVQAAIEAAEARTSGEIYCVAAGQSDDYVETPLAWAAGAAILGPALLLAAGVEVTAPDFMTGWTAAQAGAMAGAAVREALIGAVLLQGALFVVTALIVALPPVRRLLTPRSLKRDHVRRRAREQFLAKNLHLTRERTGVLIFVSLYEHMAEIVADEGIAAKVEPRVWDEAMRALTDGLKRGRAGEGFQRAIELCGRVLAEHFPPRVDDNPNELPDTLVVLPR